jgi:predicted enzyme related to lactoylglutathione lyase
VQEVDAIGRATSTTCNHHEEVVMSQGIKSVVYPVKDIARAKTFYRTLFGVEPHADQAYYVGFRVGDQEIGLDPNGHKAGMTIYYQVDDIKQSLRS